jgi:hypothetical protein
VMPRRVVAVRAADDKRNQSARRKIRPDQKLIDLKLPLVAVLWQS